MRRGVKTVGCVLTALILALGAGGCGKERGAVVEGDLPNAPMMELPVRTGPAANQNLLTGIEDLSKEAIGKRPVAVMVNNVERALPQYGIGKADIIFELPVEGSETRLMALYGDYTAMPDICSIRSCRYYYPALAKGFDAFYIHWGCDPTILDYLESLKMDRYDGIKNPHNLFDRDAARRKAGYALEHTGYFKGSKFPEVVKEEGKRTDLLESKKGTAFRFCGMDERITPQGNPCSSVHINFGAETATLRYDAQKQLYLKDINGHAHIDGATGQTLEFANVFVLETSISSRDEADHKKIDWSGSANATGYYISNGTVEKIHWSKANKDESEYLRFYRESGEELVINRGKSYIAYASAGKIRLE